jgi:hypothetical protein
MVVVAVTAGLIAAMLVLAVLRLATGLQRIRTPSPGS